METGQHVDLFDIVDTLARLVGGRLWSRTWTFVFWPTRPWPDQPSDEPRRAAILNRHTPDAWLRRPDSRYRRRASTCLRGPTPLRRSHLNRGGFGKIVIRVN